MDTILHRLDDVEQGNNHNHTAPGFSLSYANTDAAAAAATTLRQLHLPTASLQVQVQTPIALPEPLLPTPNLVTSTGGSGADGHPSSSNSAPNPSPNGFDTKGRLTLRLLSDLVAAASAGVLVAPIVTVIDRSIIETAALRTPLRTSLLRSTASLLKRPHLFFTSAPFLLVSLLYTGTYMSANAVDTLTCTFAGAATSSSSEIDYAAPSSGPMKFLATTAANTSLCLWKDACFARWFGSAKVGAARAAPVPFKSFACFGARDALTIFASFNVPPLLARILPAPDANSSSAWRRHLPNPENSAQFLCPAGVQFFSTPLHLLGLDVYNRPTGERGNLSGPSWRSRAAVVRRDWLKCAFARMGRIVPAFGVGGVVNRGVRQRLIGKVMQD